MTKPLNFKIMASTMALQPTLAYFFISETQLNEAPTDPARVYEANGKKYGQPKFRIKTRSGGDVLPDSDAFWFTKEEETQKVTLHCIIEVYRDEPDVYPLSIKNPKINLEFQAGGKTIQKALSITQSPIIDAVNILQDLHAETDVTAEMKDLIIDLKKVENTSATFKLTIKSELWWQKIAASAPPPPPPRRTGPILIPRRGAGGFVREIKFRPASPFLARDRILESRTAAIATLATAATDSGPTGPQKIDLENVIIRAYEKEDNAVFGPFSDELKVKDFNWKIESIVKSDKEYTIAYKATGQPDDFYFLPQAFRIKAKENNGEPKISIVMLAGDPAKPDSYRINIGITLIPYYNPKAKKDLYQKLNDDSNGSIKYCQLRLGSYKSAQFKLNEAFAGENSVLRGKIPESISSIDPVNGFTLTIDCSLESFDVFKNEMLNGEWFIGDIVFELVSGKEGDEAKISEYRIPVELDIRKLAGFQLEISPIIKEETTNTDPPEKTQEIKGFYLENPNDYPLSVGGAELVLISEIANTVYDADYSVGVQKTWPVALNAKQKEEVLLNENEVADIEDRAWTKLDCEPFTVSIDTKPEEILARVIDHATGDPEIWEIEISCPVLEDWDRLSPDLQAPFKQLNSVIVEIKNEKGEVFSVKLDKTKPLDKMKMARSINQILKSQQLTSRKFQYRVGTFYIVSPPHWSDFQDPESTSVNFLKVYPQPLTI